MGSTWLPASCASVTVAVAGFGVRLAQWCIAQPPAMSAAPISASRWMSSPVNASVDGAVDGALGVAVGPPVVCEPGLPDAVDGLVAGLVPLPPDPPPPWFPDNVAPAAGLAVRISGTTHAAAPAVAATDIRPRAWRLEIARLGPAVSGETGDAI
jgi:hypothetical protein